MSLPQDTNRFSHWLTGMERGVAALRGVADTSMDMARVDGSVEYENGIPIRFLQAQSAGQTSSSARLLLCLRFVPLARLLPDQPAGHFIQVAPSFLHAPRKLPVAATP